MKNYTKPEIEVTKLLTEDILSTSDNEIYMDGGELFDDLFA